VSVLDIPQGVVKSLRKEEGIEEREDERGASGEEWRIQYGKASQLRIKNECLFTMMSYPGQTLTRISLGQLCAALWYSQSRPVVIQPGIEPRAVVMPLALRCKCLRQLLHSEAPNVEVFRTYSILIYCK
jgi:hypothetical protein